MPKKQFNAKNKAVEDTKVSKKNAIEVNFISKKLLLCKTPLIS